MERVLQSDRDFKINLFFTLISPKIINITPLKMLDLNYPDLNLTRFRFTQN